MLTSLALIFLAGMLLGSLFARLRLPGLLGMLLAGILLGPQLLDLIDGAVLQISPDLRQLALVVILTRAGLSLELEDLKRVGRPALLLCFVPACFELAGVVLLAPGLLGVTALEAAILGSVLAAVSPAVVVPRMLRLMEEGIAADSGIPQLIMAGASVDDVFVLVLFTFFTSLATGGTASPIALLKVPVAIALGVAAGLLLGMLLAGLFRHIALRDSGKVIVLLSAAFLLLELEHRLEHRVAFSGLLAVMAAGMALRRADPTLAERLAEKYGKLWMAAELLLFVLVGATVDLGLAASAGVDAAALLLPALLFRMAGVFVSLIGTALSARERLFCAVAYMPKATVQAAIGGIPLAMGLACGDLVLTVAVLAILITAPLGALGMDLLRQPCLQQPRELENAKKRAPDSR